MAQGLELERNATEPSNPATGFTRVYIDTDGDLAYKRPDGSVGKVKGGGILDLAGYDLTLSGDSELAGSLTGGGTLTIPTGETAAFLRGGTPMLRGSNSATGRLPIFGSTTDVIDGSAALAYDAVNKRLTVGDYYFSLPGNGVMPLRGSNGADDRVVVWADGDTIDGYEGLTYSATTERITADGGFVGAAAVLAEQGSAPDAVADSTVVFVDASGDLCWRKDGGDVVKVVAAGAYTLTIPATGTAALLGTAQTFSAAQTFSGVVTAPGIKPSSDSTTAIQLQNAAGTAVLTVDTTSQIIYGTKFLSASPSIADDEATSIAAPASGIVMISVVNVTTGSAIIAFRSDGSYTTIIAQPSTNFEVGTAALANGDGTDGKIKVAATGGLLYISNRSGGTRAFRVTFLGA